MGASVLTGEQVIAGVAGRALERIARRTQGADEGNALVPLSRAEAIAIQWLVDGAVVIQEGDLVLTASGWVEVSSPEAWMLPDILPTIRGVCRDGWIVWRKRQ